jgi:hypothetical protein
LATAALELNRNSTPVTSRKPHRRSRSAEPAIPSAGDDFAEGSKVFDAISKGWPLVLSSLKSYH